SIDPKRSLAGLKSRSAARPGVISSSSVHDPPWEGRMAIRIRRRELIAGLGSTAAWPMAARGQQRERMRRIGVLMGMTSDDPESQVRLAALAQGLQQLGWVVSQNIQIDYRWASGNA